MIINTPSGATSVYYVPPPRPPYIAPTLYYEGGGNDDVNAFLLKGSLKRPPRPPDTARCEHCDATVLTRNIRATPLMGFVCMRCIIALSDRCYLKA